MDIQAGTQYIGKTMESQNTFFLIQIIKIGSRSTFRILITRHIKGISQHAYNMWLTGGVHNL